MDCFGVPHTIASSDRPHQVLTSGSSYLTQKFTSVQLFSVCYVVNLFKEGVVSGVGMINLLVENDDGYSIILTIILVNAGVRAWIVPCGRFLPPHSR
jgi:hypothetical protein